jgi:hypothetical protein
MQLTRFDRWLREKFVYEIHVHTLRLPEALPKGIRAVELPEVPGRRYKHLFIAKSSSAADALIAQLREDSQMYTTQIVDKSAWYVPLLAPKDKSLSWWLFSVLCMMIAGATILMYVKGLMDDPAFRKNFADAIQLLKDG